MAPESAGRAGHRDEQALRGEARGAHPGRLRRGLAAATGAGLLTVLAATHAGATVGTWNFITNVPGGRDSQAIAYGNGTTVIFGGLMGATALGDTQVLSGTTWTPVAVGDPNAPTPRYGAAMAYDDHRGVFVLFGGTPGSMVFDPRTYEFNGTSWNKINVPGPPPRFFHAMAYDPGYQVVTLFGGTSAAGSMQDTWQWNGINWQPIPATGTVPSKRIRSALAYDPDTHRLVLYGGAAGFTPLDDGYALTGALWTKICTACTGKARFAHALAYDSRQHGIVLFGGEAVGPAYLNDVWFVPPGPGPWAEIPPVILGPTPPSPRAGHGLVYDQVAGRTVLVGGTNGTDLSDTTWQLSVVGNKCLTAAQCVVGSCVDGVCCTSTCAAECHSCNLLSAAYTPPVKDGVCQPVTTAQNPDRPNDCKSTTRECVGRCMEPGKCQYPGPETPCGRPERCLACNAANGNCDQLPASDDDDQCAPPPGTPVPSCSEANISCRTYSAPAKLHRCLDKLKCGWRWSDCINYATDTCTPGQCPPPP